MGLETNNPADLVQPIIDKIIEIRTMGAAGQIKPDEMVDGVLGRATQLFQMGALDNPDISPYLQHVARDPIVWQGLVSRIRVNREKVTASPDSMLDQQIKADLRLARALGMGENGEIAPYLDHLEGVYAESGGKPPVGASPATTDIQPVQDQEVIASAPAEPTTSAAGVVSPFGSQADFDAEWRQLLEEEMTLDADAEARLNAALADATGTSPARWNSEWREVFPGLSGTRPSDQVRTDELVPAESDEASAGEELSVEQLVALVPDKVKRQVEEYRARALGGSRGYVIREILINALPQIVGEQRQPEGYIGNMDELRIIYSAASPQLRAATEEYCLERDSHGTSQIELSDRFDVLEHREAGIDTYLEDDLREEASEAYWRLGAVLVDQTKSVDEVIAEFVKYQRAENRGVRFWNKNSPKIKDMQDSLIAKLDPEQAAALEALRKKAVEFPEPLPLEVDETIAEAGTEESVAAATGPDEAAERPVQLAVAEPSFAEALAQAQQFRREHKMGEILSNPELGKEEVRLWNNVSRLVYAAQLQDMYPSVLDELSDVARHTVLSIIRDEGEGATVQWRAVLLNEQERDRHNNNAGLIRESARRLEDCVERLQRILPEDPLASTGIPALDAEKNRLFKAVSLIANQGLDSHTVGRIMAQYPQNVRSAVGYTIVDSNLSTRYSEAITEAKQGHRRNPLETVTANLEYIASRAFVGASSFEEFMERDFATAGLKRVIVDMRKEIQFLMIGKDPAELAKIVAGIDNEAARQDAISLYRELGLGEQQYQSFDQSLNEALVKGSPRPASVEPLTSVAERAVEPAAPETATQPADQRVEAGKVDGGEALVPPTRHSFIEINGIPSFSRALETQKFLQRTNGVSQITALSFEGGRLVFDIEAAPTLDILAALGTFNEEIMGRSRLLGPTELSDTGEARVRADAAATVETAGKPPDTTTEMAAIADNVIPGVERAKVQNILGQLQLVYRSRDELFPPTRPVHESRQNELARVNAQINVLQAELSDTLGLGEEESFESAQAAEAEANSLHMLSVAAMLKESARASFTEGTDGTAFVTTVRLLRKLYAKGTPEVVQALEALLKINSIDWTLVKVDQELVNQFNINLHRAAGVSGNITQDQRYKRAERLFERLVTGSEPEVLDKAVGAFRERNRLKRESFQNESSRIRKVGDYERQLASEAGMEIFYE